MNKIGANYMYSYTRDFLSRLTGSDRQESKYLSENEKQKNPKQLFAQQRAEDTLADQEHGARPGSLLQSHSMSGLESQRACIGKLKNLHWKPIELEKNIQR